jgi:hypothetical protein
MEGRWTICNDYVDGIGVKGPRTDRWEPVVPCDDAAINRASDFLLSTSDWRDMGPTEVAELVLRAAGETP